MKSTDNENIIVSHTLKNGLQVEIVDHCRLIAGDRWYVKIVCKIRGAYSTQQCQKLLTDEEYTAFLEKFPQGIITYQYKKERNFVDDGAKEDVLNDLVSQIEDSNLEYMAKASFAENLLQKMVDEFVVEFKVRKEMGLLNTDEEIEEPDDFSACFK